MLIKNSYSTGKYFSIYRKTLGIISIALLFLFFASCDNSVDPTELDYHNKILFTSSRSGKEQLYMMNPDGTHIKQITSGEFSHSAGRWSPDASKIICNTDQNITTAGLQMVILNSDGTNRRLLGIGSQMVWLPDESKFFFTFCPGCEIGIFNAALYCTDPDSQNVRLVSQDFAGDISILPDKSTIAYIEVNPNDSIPKPIIKLIDYPTLYNIRTIGPVGVICPKWGPYGNNIAFSSQNEEAPIKDSKTYDIFIMDSKGYNVQKITNHFTGDHFLYPDWSNDGLKIIFIAFSTDGTQRKYIYMINSDGSNLHRVINDSTITSADWSK